MAWAPDAWCRARGSESGEAARGTGADRPPVDRARQRAGAAAPPARRCPPPLRDAVPRSGGASPSGRVGPAAGGRGLSPALHSLLHRLGRFHPGDEGVVGVVVLPLAVPPGENDVVLREPGTDPLHVLRSTVIVDDVGYRQIHLVGGPDRIVVTDEADLDGVVDAPPDQLVPFAGERLGR